MTEPRPIYTTGTSHSPDLDNTGETVQEFDAAALTQARANDLHTRRVLLNLVDLIERRWCITPRTAERRR